MGLVCLCVVSLGLAWSFTGAKAETITDRCAKYLTSRRDYTLESTRQALSELHLFRSRHFMKFEYAPIAQAVTAASWSSGVTMMRLAGRLTSILQERQTNGVGAFMLGEMIRGRNRVTRNLVRRMQRARELEHLAAQPPWKHFLTRFLAPPSEERFLSRLDSLNPGEWLYTSFDVPFQGWALQVAWNWARPRDAAKELGFSGPGWIRVDELLEKGDSGLDKLTTLIRWREHRFVSQPQGVE